MFKRTSPGENCWPSEHIVDAGYVTADHLVSSQTDHAITLLGPVAEGPSWQVEEGYDVATFRIDWEAKRATGPQGHVSTQWIAGQDRHNHEIVNCQHSVCACRLTGLPGAEQMYPLDDATASTGGALTRTTRSFPISKTPADHRSLSPRISDPGWD